MIPGEIFVGEEPITINAGRPTTRLMVANRGDRPVQVGSHYHFYEVNEALQFDREAARGQHLDLPAGMALRFEPGDSKEVVLVPFAGKRVIDGFRGLVNGPLEDHP